MSRIEKKISQMEENAFAQGPSAHQKEDRWINKIGGRQEPSPPLPGSKKLTVNGIEKSAVTNAIATRILFPSALFGRIKEVKKMPESTLEEKIAKEDAFRNLILQQFHIEEVISDNHCGLRAIICAVTPGIDPNSEEITAIILRGDIIQHIMKNPKIYQEYNGAKDIKDPELLKASLREYCSRMVNSETPIGELEIMTMSEILKTPIHIISYNNPGIGTNGEIVSGGDNTFGKNYEREPIFLYFDPVRSHYLPMIKLNQ